MSSASCEHLVSPIANQDIPLVSLTKYVTENFEKFGERPAMIDANTGRKISYSDILGGIRKLACGLSARGFKKGDILAVFSPNIPEYGTVFHAVASLGGAVTTANPLYTASELEHQLRDSGAKYMMTMSPFLNTAKEAAVAVGIKEIYSFDKCDDTVYFGDLLVDGNPPQVDIDPLNDIVALPYSSGTTGLPKGVVLTHHNLVANLVQIAALESDILQEDVFIAVLPFYHIYAMTLLLNFSLRVGVMSLVMSKFDLVQYLELIQTHKVTYLHLVPPIALALAKHPLVDKYDLSSLKLVFSGAAPLSGDIEKAVTARLNVKVKQAYGMTEMSPASHINPTHKIKSGSIGVLLPNQEAKILDLVTGSPVPVGEEGELLVKGPNIMKGYLNKPEDTARTIGDDGFLRTGDVAKVDQDGYFFVVDRVKELIKYKGYQVAPAELEALLLNHEAVTDCAVIPKPDEEAGEVPKAFIVLKKDHQVTEEDIEKWVAERVAAFKKIRDVEFVDSIPKSASGKILRRILVLKEREKLAASH